MTWRYIVNNKRHPKLHNAQKPTSLSWNQVQAGKKSNEYFDISPNSTLCLLLDRFIEFTVISDDLSGMSTLSPFKVEWGSANNHLFRHSWVGTPSNSEFSNPFLNSYLFRVYIHWKTVSVHVSTPLNTRERVEVWMHWSKSQTYWSFLCLVGQLQAEEDKKRISTAF